jgi:hypothetical protein
MKLSRRKFLHLAGVAAAVAFLAVTLSGHDAWSVPFSPGGACDILGPSPGRADRPRVMDPQPRFKSRSSCSSAAKVEMTFVPYPGDAPAVIALLGEHVTSVFSSYSTVASN